MTKQNFGDVLKSYWPMFLLAGSLIASGAVAQFQISAHASGIADNAESIDSNENAINDIQKILIRRQGEVENQVQRIELEQKEQGEDLEQILRLLEDIRRGD